MAAPNLQSLTNQKIDTAILPATNTMTDLIAAVATNHAFGVEAIYCCNKHATVAGWITVVHKKGGTEYEICKEMPVSTHTTVNPLLGKPLYLAEGDSLRVQANASSNIVCLAPYSDVS